MTSPNPLLHRHRLADKIVRTALRQAATMIRWSMSAAGSGDHPTELPEAVATSLITFVDDPDGRVRLIGVRGLVHLALLDELWTAVESDELIEAVHIDLTATEIAIDGPIDFIAEIEAGFDRAERRGIRLRVVGLDPEHPALLRRTSR